MNTIMSKIFVLLISSIIVWGCQSNPTTLSESEKDSIINEVRHEFDKSMAAANNHDADGIMQIMWNSPDYLYVGNGIKTTGWESALKAFSSVHSNPKYKSFTVDLDDVIIHVIDRQAAMVIAEGNFNNFPTNDGPISIKFVFTSLMENIDGKWVVTVGHESTLENMWEL